jgi:hypothetical protein
VDIVAHVGLSPGAKERPKGMVDLLGILDGATYVVKTGLGASAVFNFKSMYQRHGMEGFRISANLRPSGPDFALVLRNRTSDLDADLEAIMNVLRNLDGDLIKVDMWRDAVKGAGIWKDVKKPGTWRQKWARAIEALQAADMVVIENGTASLAADQ